MKRVKFLLLICLAAAVLIIVGPTLLDADELIETGTFYGSSDRISENSYELGHSYYNLLSSKEKKAYSLIDRRILNFPDEIKIPALSHDEFENVFEALCYDNPEYFFLSKECALSSSGSRCLFIPKYSLSKEDYEEKRRQAATEARKVLNGIRSDAGEYERALYIHDSLARNCSYCDLQGGLAYTMYGALVEGKASCEGYAKAMQYLLLRAGIDSCLITGSSVNADGVQQPHMWNIARIDGQDCNIDVTWDDYSLNCAGLRDSTPSHMYFNVSRALLESTHTADYDELWENCNGEDFTYFRSRGLYFSVCDEQTAAVIKRETARNLRRGSLSIELAFSNASAYSEALPFLLRDNDRMYNILYEINESLPSYQRINPNQLRYTCDKNMRIIRFFFSRK